MSKQYRKKPVIIEAVQYDGNNYLEILKFTKLSPEDMLPFMPNYDFSVPNWDLIIPTLEGNMTAKVDDYIIKGVQGEFYPCKPDIFDETYEEVEE